jgi:hypothetical protein
MGKKKPRSEAGLSCRVDERELSHGAPLDDADRHYDARSLPRHHLAPISRLVGARAAPITIGSRSDHRAVLRLELERMRLERSRVNRARDLGVMREA